MCGAGEAPYVGTDMERRWYLSCGLDNGKPTMFSRKQRSQQRGK